MYKSVNIFSGTKDGPLAAVLTNPTELAFVKGKLKKHYPVVWNGIEYPDAEAAYQHNKWKVENSQTARHALLSGIMEAKLRQHPLILEYVEKAGGIEWLKTCTHYVGSYESYWTGRGMQSGFIRGLIEAIERIKKGT